MANTIYIYSSWETGKEMLKVFPDLRMLSGLPKDNIKGQALAHYRTILFGVDLSKCSLVELEPILLYDIADRRQYERKTRSAADYTKFEAKPPEGAWLDALDMQFAYSWKKLIIGLSVSVALVLLIARYVL